MLPAAWLGACSARAPLTTTALAAPADDPKLCRAGAALAEPVAKVPAAARPFGWRRWRNAVAGSLQLAGGGGGGRGWNMMSGGAANRRKPPLAAAAAAGRQQEG